MSRIYIPTNKELKPLELSFAGVQIINMVHQRLIITGSISIGNYLHVDSTTNSINDISEFGLALYNIKLTEVAHLFTIVKRDGLFDGNYVEFIPWLTDCAVFFKDCNGFTII